MDRRTAVRAMLASGPAILVAGAGGSLAAEARPVPRIAYHLADLEKAGFVLGNLRNHVDGMGGPEGVKLAVVVHGPALRAFRADSGNEDFKARFGRLVQGQLEGSNVEIVQEMVDMISAQRAYEINSKAVKAADEMSQTATEMIR